MADPGGRLEPGGELRRIVNADLEVLALPREGVVLTIKLTEILRVEPGDDLTVGSGTIKSNSGSITLTGGDAVDIQAGVNLLATAAGQDVTLNVDPATDPVSTSAGVLPRRSCIQATRL